MEPFRIRISGAPLAPDESLDLVSPSKLKASARLKRRFWRLAEWRSAIHRVLDAWERRIAEGERGLRWREERDRFRRSSVAPGNRAPPGIPPARSPEP